MAEEKNKSIASTFNTQVRTSWVWMVLAMTIGLTVLFYFSQKQQVVTYARYIKSLSDYHLQETNVMRSMDRVRLGVELDSAAVLAQVTTLREMAVAISRDIDEIRNEGGPAPSVAAVNRFEKEVVGKVAGMRRYTALRFAWFKDHEKCVQQVMEMDRESRMKVWGILDAARKGYDIVFTDGTATLDVLPDTLKASVVKLLKEHEELSLAWKGFSNDMAIAYSEDLAQFFLKESMSEMSQTSKIPTAFYFLSLVLLLSTFFFVLYARR